MLEISHLLFKHLLPFCRRSTLDGGDCDRDGMKSLSIPCNVMASTAKANTATVATFENHILESCKSLRYSCVVNLVVRNGKITTIHAEVLQIDYNKE